MIDLCSKNVARSKRTHAANMFYITKSYLYNFGPLKPHFYIIKMVFTEVYVIFLILLKTIGCGYSFEPSWRCGSNEYHNLYFEQKYEKYQNFLSENFQFLGVKFSIYLHRRVFVIHNVIRVSLYGVV